jgi:hypothetical protein
MRYTAAGLALAGVSFSVRHGEKVGIVGRPALASLPCSPHRMFDLAVRSSSHHITQHVLAVKEPLRTCLVTHLPEQVVLGYYGVLRS